MHTVSLYELENAPELSAPLQFDVTEKNWKGITQIQLYYFYFKIIYGGYKNIYVELCSCRTSGAKHITE